MATDVEAPTLRAVADDTEDAQGADFKERRLALGLSISELAKRAGIDRGVLTKIEAGEPGRRDTSLGAVERALLDLEQATGMNDPDKPRVVRFVVRGVYGAESLVVEGPVESIAELERSVDRIMRRLRTNIDDEP